MSTDNRALREHNDLIEQKFRAEFLAKELVCLDSSWSIDSNLSVYVYLEVDHELPVNTIWYVLNDSFVYFTVYSSLEDLMDAIDHNSVNDSRYLDLTKKEMEQVDLDLNE